MAGNGDIMDGIEPCRTCGIFYLTASNFLRKIFDAPNEEQNLSHILAELSTWSIQITQDDGLPQYICTCCILEFTKYFKFRELCIELQTQWRHFYQIREENKIFIKKELPDPDEKKEENNCDFIYVDDLSDSEYTANGDGGGGGGGSFAPFNITHVPIKEEPQENRAIANDVLISTTEKETCNTNNIENNVEASEGTINSNALFQVTTNLNSTVLDSPKPQQVLGENLSENTSLQQISQDDNDVTTIECNLCLHVSVNAELHRQHMQRIHEIKDMDCHICGKQFINSTATRLKYHLKWHRISKHIKCAQCGFFCDSRDTLKEHVKATHSKIECKTCGKRVLGKKMKMHMRTHEVRTWPCSYCNDVFSTENLLESHIWEIHAQEETQPIAVAAEDNDFSNNMTAEDGEEEPLSCNLCDQLYPNQHELNAHKLQSHLMENVTDTETMCDNAEPEPEADQFNYQDTTDMMEEMSMTNLENINEPMTTEVEEPDAMMLQQSQTNSNNESVFTQVISSDEEAAGKNEILKEYDCPKCSQKFSSTADLCLHYQEHLEKSEFGCYLCGKSFKIKFSLNRHLKRHK